MKDLINFEVVANRPLVRDSEADLVIHEYSALSSLLGSTMAINTMAKNGRDGALKSLLQFPGDVEGFLAG